MSVLFKLLNVIVIITQVISATYVQQFTTPGNYTVMIPANSWVTVSLWGVGGAGTGISFGPASSARMYPGGSGAFVSFTTDAPPGSTIYLLVVVVEHYETIIKKPVVQLMEEVSYRKYMCIYTFNY